MEREKEVVGGEGDERALQRIVALLFALAHIADRGGSIAFPVRVVRSCDPVVHAETRRPGVRFHRTASGPSRPDGTTRRPRDPARQPLVAGHYRPAEAARLASGLRALALFIANRAIRAFPIDSDAVNVRRAISAKRNSVQAQAGRSGGSSAPDNLVEPSS